MSFQRISKFNPHSSTVVKDPREISQKVFANESKNTDRDTSADVVVDFGGRPVAELQVV
jgi:hypothetical protein